jgi:hypothetical protein
VCDEWGWSVYLLAALFSGGGERLLSMGGGLWWELRC